VVEGGQGGATDGSHSKHLALLWRCLTTDSSTLDIVHCCRAKACTGKDEYADLCCIFSCIVLYILVSPLRAAIYVALIAQHTGAR